jgi:hypothetical protein
MRVRMPDMPSGHILPVEQRPETGFDRLCR